MANFIHSETCQAIDLYYQRLHETQSLTPDVVMRIFIQTFSGMRLTIPGMEYLDRKHRNERIKNLFWGGNYGELAIRFNLSEIQIRRIVHGD